MALRPQPQKRMAAKAPKPDVVKYAKKPSRPANGRPALRTKGKG